MKKEYLYSIITLTFCAQSVDFITLFNESFVYPRDRIIHIFISFLLFAAVAFILKDAYFSGNILKIAALGYIAWRVIYLVQKYIRYFSTFHGSNSTSIILLSIAAAMIIFKFQFSGKRHIYNFFILFNVFMLLLVFILAAGKISPMNIYSNSLKFNFSYEKLYMFFDVFTIAVMIKDKKDRVFVQKRFLILSGIYCLVFTVLQGLCVKGNLLYSVSPLQSLMLIFSTETVKRFDYIITTFETVNYFGAVILYSWAAKEILVKEKEKIIENN